MSIELEDPKSPLELADAIGNLIEQIRLASMMNDKQHMAKAIDRAAELSFVLVDKLQDE